MLLLRAVAVYLACCVTTEVLADEYDFDGWKVTVTQTKFPSPDSTERESERPVVRRERVIREVRVIRAASSEAHSCGLPYYYGLPRIGANYSVYFPWKNYRGYYGYSSQYRPRTIYNYGW